MKTLFRRPLRLLILTCVFGLATASAASAATVSFDGTTMTFNAAAGEANDVNATQSTSDVTLHDFNNPVTADTGAIGAGCTQVDANTVTCPNVSALSAALGDQNDNWNSASDFTVPQTIDGGDGNDDSLEGGLGNDVIHGGPGDDSIFGDSDGPSTGGNDQLFGDDGADNVHGGPGDDITSGGAGDDFASGGPGTDQVNGDAGDDSLQGGPGADNGDVISGGTGIDNVIYFHNSPDDTTPVTLTLDDQANDGLAGENDNIKSDVEDVYADVNNPTTITGTAAVNSVSGSNGNDTIDAGDNNDIINANAGDDTINANDGWADRVSCGAGNDTANVDEFDIVSESCETVNRTTRGSLATEDKPPSISWTAPADNARLPTSSATTLSVNATDDKGIAQVIFLDGERVLCTDTTAPYTCAFNPTDADVGRDTLTAMAVDTSQQTATALRQVSVGRFAPLSVTSRTTPGRDRRAPFKFKTTGKVNLPANVSAAACNGNVGVIFKAGSKTISSRTAHLSKTCTFSRKVTFTIPRRLHPRTLKVEVKFRGNAVLLAKRAKSRHVKVR
ncbi:MAG TPA: Ig-like domain-containing protein [Solirubrobacteraceae bacterium]|nr:Ig-like domain-containing protein [Solirubrobacteraceae bacterium]